MHIYLSLSLSLPNAGKAVHKLGPVCACTQQPGAMFKRMRLGLITHGCNVYMYIYIYI